MISDIKKDNTYIISFLPKDDPHIIRDGYRTIECLRWTKWMIREGVMIRVLEKKLKSAQNSLLLIGSE